MIKHIYMYVAVELTQSQWRLVIINVMAFLITNVECINTNTYAHTHT